MSKCYYADLEMISHCTELCNLAQSRLCGIDQTIEYLQKNASMLIDEDISGLIKDLEASKENILSKIHEISSSVSSANTQMSYDEVREMTNRTRSLLSEANDVSIIKMGVIKNMIRESLDSAIKEHEDEVKRLSEGRAKKRNDLSPFLESISDAEVRGTVRILVRNPEYNNLSLNEIKNLAEKRLGSDASLPESDINNIRKQILTNMADNCVEGETISAIMNDFDPSAPNVLKLINESDEAVISEKIRKNAINAIILNITDKGFIVEKKNIRLIREKNEVKITAMKPGGQRAEFHINLNGSFIYKFDEYEGQACQKDITPFIADLDSVYGMKVGNIKEEWSNPDKSAKMNYQKTDVMRGG